MATRLLTRRAVQSSRVARELQITPSGLGPRSDGACSASWSVPPLPAPPPPSQPPPSPSPPSPRHPRHRRPHRRSPHRSRALAAAALATALAAGFLAAAAFTASPNAICQRTRVISQCACAIRSALARSRSTDAVVEHESRVCWRGKKVVKHAWVVASRMFSAMGPRGVSTPSERLHQRLARSPQAASATVHIAIDTIAHKRAQNHGARRPCATHVNSPSQSALCAPRSPLHTARTPPPPTAHCTPVGARMSAGFKRIAQIRVSRAAIPRRINRAEMPPAAR